MNSLEGEEDVPRTCSPWGIFFPISKRVRVALEVQRQGTAHWSRGAPGCAGERSGVCCKSAYACVCCENAFAGAFGDGGSRQRWPCRLQLLAAEALRPDGSGVRVRLAVEAAGCAVMQRTFLCSRSDQASWEWSTGAPGGGGSRQCGCAGCISMPQERSGQMGVECWCAWRWRQQAVRLCRVHLVAAGGIQPQESAVRVCLVMETT